MGTFKYHLIRASMIIQVSVLILIISFFIYQGVKSDFKSQKRQTKMLEEIYISKSKTDYDLNNLIKNLHNLQNSLYYKSINEIEKEKENER